jgi:hypothetical protein
MKGKLCFKGNILFYRGGANFHALWASALLILSILFYSCDFGLDGNSFQNKAGAYFKEMTSTAAVAAYSMDMADVLVDKDGNFCFGYDEDKTITFTLRNPMRYSFVSGQNMSVELAPGSGASLQKKDLVTIRQDAADSSTLYLTFPAEFLKANPLGADITPTIALRHPVSLTPFPLYDSLKLSSNPPPPMPSGALTMQTTETPSRWVLCFNLPKKAMVQSYHNDIESVAVNGKTFAATVAADGTISYEAGSEISTVAPANIVANQNTGLSFNADENAAYFLTGDEADEKEKIYTVVVTDKAGLSSNLAVSTRGFKLGSPDAFAKTDTQFANKFKVYDSADPDGTKNSVEQDEDDSVYVAIKAEAKTASVDYTDPVTGETKHVDSYDYDKSDACVMWEVYRDEACSSFVGAGKINGLQGTISIPAGTSFVRAYVRKPLYSDSEVITWKCRAVFTRFYVSEEGDDNAEGSRKKPFRTIQRAVDAFVDGIASGDCVADSLCDIRVMTDLTTPDSYDFSAHGGYLLNVADSSLASATIKVSGLGGTKTISAAQAGSSVRKLVNAAVGKTVIQNINLTGGAVEATDSYATSALILAAGAELDFNGSKVYGNTLSGERDSSANEGSVILSEGILKMSGTTVCDNAGIVTGSGSEAPVFYALWSCSGSAAASELTDCEFSGHGEGWTVVRVDSLPVKMIGGAIKNNVGCEAAVEATEHVELSGVEISGNVCKTTAIDNYYDLILDGCTITGNVSKAAPASGKAAGVSLYALGSGMSITLNGANTIYDNHFESEPGRQSNLYIPYGKKITVGANISGSKIGVTMPFNDTTKPTKETPVVFTTNYATFANPATPGSVFVSENDYGVAAIPSGATNAGEAAFAVSSGGMYGPYDYTITTSAPSVEVAPGEAKSVALTTTVTRKEPAGSTPPETRLYYNPADRKLYLEDTFVTLAVEDRAGDPDYNKVSWTAALYAGTSKACDVPIRSSASGLTAEVPAMDLEYDYSLRITADFLGVGNHASFVYKVKEPLILHPTPIAAPALDTDSAGASGKYIYFGDWPQTIKAASVTVDETKTMTQGAFTYYKGSDGFWYAKAEERANRADFAYSDGTPAAQGGASFKYFKVEPIKWRVINENYNSEGNWQLISERILTANILWYDSRNDRTIGGETIKHYNYEHSRIRAYLNGISYNKVGSDSDEFVDKGFLQTAFDSAAQDAMLQVTVSSNGGATNDKVFLVLGNSELSGFRKRKVTDFALANNAWKSSDDCGYWWTRSAGNNGNISYYNNVGSTGDPRYCNGYPDYGVVPCLVIPPLP